MDRLFSWQGASRAWYVHTALNFFNPGWVGAANYVFVRRGPAENRSPLYFGETDDFDRRWGEHCNSGLVGDALRRGANELHVHLLSRTKAARLNVETDLRNGHATALNLQPTLARNALAPDPPRPSGILASLEGLALLSSTSNQPPRNALAGLMTPRRPSDGLSPAPTNALKSLLPQIHPLEAFNPFRGLK